MYNGYELKKQDFFGSERIGNMQRITLQEKYKYYTKNMQNCQNELKELIEQNVLLNDDRVLKISRECDEYTAKIYELSEQMKKIN